MMFFLLSFLRPLQSALDAVGRIESTEEGIVDKKNQKKEHEQ